MTHLDGLFEKIKQAEIASHYWHLNTTSYAQHQALGMFYEELQGIGDAIAEACMGKHQKTLMIPEQIKLPGEFSVDYFERLGEYFDMYITMYSKDLDLQDHVLDARNLVNKVLYLLRLS